MPITLKKAVKLILKIAQLGNPVLRAVAEPLSDNEIKSNDTNALLGSMIATLRDAGGVGLAAPQIHVSKRIFIACLGEEAQEANRLEVFINPKITSKSNEMQLEWEGCLSFIELKVLVPRHQNNRNRISKHRTRKLPA